MLRRIVLFLFVFPWLFAFSSFGYTQSVSAPGINPLRDMSSYTTAEVSKNAELELDIPVGEGFRRIKVTGDVWYLSKDGDDQDALQQQFKTYVASIGGEILFWAPRATVVRKDDGDGVIWWCLADFDSGMHLSVIRTQRIEPGKPLTFDMGASGRDEVRFFMDNPGGRFRSLSVTLENGEFTLTVEQIMQAGAYRRSVRGKWYMVEYKANRHSIDAIPQEAGTCLFTLYNEPGAGAAKVTVELKEYPYAVPKVEFGEKLGALRIKNIPYGLARIKTDNRFGLIETQHPEFPTGSGFENGDVTPEGDAYFLMPAGLWQVEVVPTALSMAHALRAQYVPVHSGKETVLDWPLAMTNVFGKAEGSGLEINAVGHKDGEGMVTFSLHGEEAKSIAPTPKELNIKEGGAGTKILSVKRTKIPLDIVLLVDSSGSMKGQMKNALTATRKFIQALPDDARVRVVDFDTKPKPLKANNKAEALKGLAGIKANGATCLNDAVLLGLQMLDGAKRPALLVFTDGFDANYNDTGPGSKATKDAVLAGVKIARISVFTIGFGKGHDINTLDRIASLSGGRYYAASDPKALDKAFAVISSNLSNTFTARYERPSQGRPSDVPVITCMVDVSGSMNMTPDMAGCNYRIDKVKTILHDFFTSLPRDVLAQAMTFWEENTIEQVTTANMGEVLSAFADMDPDGGTEIANAIKTVLETQAAIPSSKRYMVFITDAALQVDEEEKIRFDTMLAKLKDEGIYCLWVGIGALDGKPFKYAAEVSGGSYVITEDPADLARSFDEMITDIRKPVAASKEVKTMVEVTLKHREASGRNLTFARAKQAVMPALKVDDTVEIPAAIATSLAPLKERFSPEVAAMITGDSVPVRDTKISKRIPIGVTGKNKAAAFTVKEAFFMNRLRRVDPPTGQRYLVLTMEMKNILPKQKVIVYPDGANHPAAWVGNDVATKGKELMMVPTYLIPDLKRHLFLRWNNETMTPVSPATWLAESPLIMPGEDAVAIAPKKPVTGALVFLVPDGSMKQMSLHYYDTNYGHLDIPVVGTVTASADRVSDLPAKPPVKLSDVFSLAIREVKDVPKIGRHAPGDGCVYRIVEADFISNVQALLDLNPKERFSLRLNTKAGALGVQLHNVTGFLPLGFLSPTMLSPGSTNRIRVAFRVPAAMAKEAGKGELVVDVKGGAVVIPLDAQAAKAPVAKVPTSAIQGDAIQLVVNSLKRFGDSDDKIVADLTLFDSNDGQATAMADAFILKKKNFDPGKAESAQLPDYGASKGLAGFAAGNDVVPVGTMPPHMSTEDMIFGITDATVVPDGGSLRGLVVFKLPYGDTDPGDWQLTSPLFPDLKRGIDSGRYRNERLMARRNEVAYGVGDTYLDQLNAVVIELKRQREASQFKRPGYYKPKTMAADGSRPPACSVPVPEATDPALADFGSIKDLKSLKKRLATLRYLPSAGMGWEHFFAPQAVLTQNWGCEGDFARMAEIILARQGIQTKRITLKVTDQGRDRLAKMAGVNETEIEQLPALTYHDGKGVRQTLVAPFLEPNTGLGGLVAGIYSDDVSSREMTATVTVNLLARPIQNGQARASRELSDALSGETEAGAVEEIFLLSANPTLPELSRGAVDIGYTVVGQKSGPVVKAVFDGNNRRIIGDDMLDTGEYEVVGERITISMPNSSLTFERYLDAGEVIVDRFHTLGLNLPDMPMGTAKTLDAAMQKIHKAEDAPDNLSALKWYARNLIYKFVSTQTEFETDQAKQMDLVIGRTTKPRCIIATVSRKSKDDTVRTALDLRQVANQVHPSPAATEEARHGFNIATGLFVSKLEANILPEGGIGFFEMLAYYPEDTRFLWLDDNARYEMEEELNKAMPERVFKLIMANSATILFPDQPALINGQPRWAWLEVDPDSYRTIAVLDTGERGAMVERVFGELWKDGLDYITGGLVGVSSSIWSVSAFSLVMDDYKKIMAEAKKFALGLANNFSGSVKVGDFEVKGTIGSSDPEGSYSGTGSDALNAAGNAKSMYDKIKDPKVDLGGFEGGFKDGVSFYFSRAGS